MCECSEDAARAAGLGELKRLNVLLTSATENESPQSLGVGHVGGTVLFSKWAKKVCANSAIYPQFLFCVGFNRHSGNNIPYTLPDELSYNVFVYVNVILRDYLEHIPVHMIKTILKHGLRLVRPVLKRP